MTDPSSTDPDVPGRAPTSATDGQRARQDLIRARVVEDGFVRTDDLARLLGVSIMTVHRDLDSLQSQGWLRKMRGGATALPSAVFHGDVGQRMAAMTEQKRRMARAALELVSPGNMVMIDESTTCLHAVQHLAEHGPLTVITHFLPAIKLLAGEPGVHLVALGGSYFPAYEAFLGLHTAEAVAAFRADVVLMSTTAISKGRCYHQSQETVQVKRAMMAQAARRVLLVDHTKFAREGLYALAGLDAFDLIITDDRTPSAEQQRIRDLGVRLRVV